MTKSYAPISNLNRNTENIETEMTRDGFRKTLTSLSYIELRARVCVCIGRLYACRELFLLSVNSVDLDLAVFAVDCHKCSDMRRAGLDRPLNYRPLVNN